MEKHRFFYKITRTPFRRSFKNTLEFSLFQLQNIKFLFISKFYTNQVMLNTLGTDVLTFVLVDFHTMYVINSKIHYCTVVLTLQDMPILRTQMYKKISKLFMLSICLTEISFKNEIISILLRRIFINFEIHT